MRRRYRSLEGGTRFRRGQRLVVPVREYDGALATEADSDSPLRVQYGTASLVRPLDPIDTTTDVRASNASSEPDTSVSAQPLASSSGQSAGTGSSSDEVSSFYRVQRGDTLGGIAQRFGVSVAQLRAWNDLNGSRIYPGQRLRISK